MNSYGGGLIIIQNYASAISAALQNSGLVTEDNNNIMTEDGKFIDVETN